MPYFSKPIPLSLYVHLPWCIQKCPYCDFNSHAIKRETLPEEDYTNALLAELDHHLRVIDQRSLLSIFFGGGTPSLFSPNMIAKLLDGIAQRFNFSPSMEITLEANPGTVEQKRFKDYHDCGINRLSLGIQSFQDEQLNILGRVHNSNEAKNAIHIAQRYFDRINLDLMYGLPHQSIENACHDLEIALSFHPTHLSWYQLTIEPNTVFYKKTPPLPQDEMIDGMETIGRAYLAKNNFRQYEVSAYAKNEAICQHNRHYWEFGDYLGIGAGAHSKLTYPDEQKIIRFAQIKQPYDYLQSHKQRTISQHQQILSQQDLIFEFMLNALRLTEGVPLTLFHERTGLSLDIIRDRITLAQEKGLLLEEDRQLITSMRGKKYLNELIQIFM